MALEHRLTIASDEFTRVIRTVKRGGRGANLPAFMRVDGAVLTLDWCGAAAAAPCTSTSRFAVRLPAVAMRTMAAGGKRLPELVEITHTGDRLDFGMFSVPCEAVEDNNAVSLPVGAGDLEILAIGLTEPNEVVSQKGLAEELVRVRQRFSRSVEQTANALKWLQIDGDLVASWLEAHVRARAEGEVSFEIASGTVHLRGQLDLF